MAIISNGFGISLTNVGYRHISEHISLKYGINKANERKAIVRKCIVRRCKESYFDIRSRGSRKNKTKSH